MEIKTIKQLEEWVATFLKTWKEDAHRMLNNPYQVIRELDCPN